MTRAYEIATIGDLEGCCEECAAGAPPCGSARMGELAPETEAAQLLAAGFFPTVWPTDVDAYKARIDPDFRATDAMVSRCANLGSAEAVAWGDFFTSWQKFAKTSTPLASSWEQHLEEAKRFEARLRDWQAQLAPVCGKGPAPPLGPAPGKPIPWGAVAVVAVATAVVGAIGYSFYKAGKKASSRAAAGEEWLMRVAPGAIESASGSRALARR